MIITMSSGSKTHVGKVALANDNTNCVFGAFCAKLSASEQIVPKYLYYLLMSGQFRRYIEEN
jgi:type I restriction enzyme S subunit